MILKDCLLILGFSPQNGTTKKNDQQTTAYQKPTSA